MSDDGLDSGSPSEFLFDLAVDAALLPGTIDPVRPRRIVADIALVDIGPLDLATGQGAHGIGLQPHVPLDTLWRPHLLDLRLRPPLLFPRRLGPSFRTCPLYLLYRPSQRRLGIPEWTG